MCEQIAKVLACLLVRLHRKQKLEGKAQNFAPFTECRPENCLFKYTKIIQARYKLFLI